MNHQQTSSQLHQQPSSQYNFVSSADDDEENGDPIEKELRKKMLSMLGGLNPNLNPNPTATTTSTNINPINLNSSFSTAPSSYNSNTNNNQTFSSSTYNNNLNYSSSNNPIYQYTNQQQQQQQFNINQYNQQPQLLHQQQQQHNLNHSVSTTNNFYNNPIQQQQQQQQQNDSFNLMTSSKNVINTINTNNNNNMNMNNSNNSSSGKKEKEDEYFNLDETYVTCERERIKLMSSEYQYDIVSEFKILREYRLYVVEEWIYKSNHIWSAVEYTGNPSDEIFVSIVKPSLLSSHSQFRQFYNFIAKPPNTNFYSVRTPLGQLLLANSGTASQYGLNLVSVPDGDFDKHIASLKLNLSLKRLCCTNQSYQLSIQKVSESVERNFETLSGYSHTNLTTVTHFIKEIQAALSHLNYLPLLTKIDGAYDQRTVNAIKAFQVDYNKKKENILPTEGYLDSQTFKGITNEIYLLAKKLESLGFKIPDKPVKNYIDFNQLIKEFQDIYGIYPDAPGKNILTYLDKLKNINPITVNNNNINNNAINNNNISTNNNVFLQNQQQQQQHDEFIDEEELLDEEEIKSEKSYYESGSSNFNSENESNENYNNYQPSSPIPLRYTNKYQHQHQQNNGPSSHPNTPPSYSPSTTSTTPNSNHFLSSPNLSQTLLSTTTNQKPQNIITSTKTKQQQQQQQQQHHQQQQSKSSFDDLETIAEAEEKEKLKQTILKLESLVDYQQTEYNKLKEEFEQMIDNYSELKEQSMRSIAIVSTNEKLFQEINHRWSKILKKELPEIEEKINSNVESIQSYSNRMKRLDDIVSSVQRKHERNIFSWIEKKMESIL
eukprot:gene1114-1419_t